VGSSHLSQEQQIFSAVFAVFRGVSVKLVPALLVGESSVPALMTVCIDNGCGMIPYCLNRLQWDLPCGYQSIERLLYRVVTMQVAVVVVLGSLLQDVLDTENSLASLMYISSTMLLNQFLKYFGAVKVHC
jgi:hypothetical protein